MAPRFMSMGLPVIALVGGLVIVLAGAQVPYAYLAGGDSISIEPARPLVLAAVMAGAWLAAGSRRIRWLAVVVALGAIVTTGYLLIVSLRGIPGWAAVWYGQDATAGPGFPLIAFGLVIIGIGTLARAAGSRGPGSHRTSERRGDSLTDDMGSTCSLPALTGPKRSWRHDAAVARRRRGDPGRRLRGVGPPDKRQARLPASPVVNVAHM